MKSFILFIISIISLVSCTKDTIENNNETDLYVRKIPVFDTVKQFNGINITILNRLNNGNYIASTNGFRVYYLDSNFNTIWENDGHGIMTQPATIIPSNDGGFIAIGTASTSEQDTTSNGGYEIALVKLDQNGDLVWNKFYGGSNSESTYLQNTLIQTEDGGYAFIGNSSSNDGDVISNNGDSDAWFVKTDSNGNIEFETSFGGSGADFGRKIIKTGQYFTILMKSNSSDGIFNKVGHWVFQADVSGNILWKTYVGGMNAGNITNYNDNIIVANAEAYTYKVNMLNNNGEIIYEEIIDLGGTGQAFVNKIIQGTDNSIFVTGSKGENAILVKLNPKLKPVYSKNVTTGIQDHRDELETIIPISDDTYINLIYRRPYGMVTNGIVEHSTSIVKLTEKPEDK